MNLICRSLALPDRISFPGGSNGVKYLFETARRYNCVLFLDEIDAVGNRDSLTSDDNVINTLLAELDGYSERQIMVIGATNRKDKLDPALLRAGRLHEIIEIGVLQNPEDRRKLLQLTCKKADYFIKNENLIDFIVKTTSHCSPATLVALVRETLQLAIESGRGFVTREDFITARHAELTGKETQRVSLSPENRKKVAIHESGHALVSYLRHQPFVQVSIKSGAGMLGFLETSPSEMGNYSEKELLYHIDVCLAGHAAEKILSSPSEGSTHDFRMATLLALRYYRAGFGENVSYAILSDNEESEKTLLPKINSLLAVRMETTIALLKTYSSLLQKVVDELNAHDVLFEEDLQRFKCEIEGPKTPNCQVQTF